MCAFGALFLIFIIIAIVSVRIFLSYQSIYLCNILRTTGSFVPPWKFGHFMKCCFDSFTECSTSVKVLMALLQLIHSRYVRWQLIEQLDSFIQSSSLIVAKSCYIQQYVHSPQWLRLIISKTVRLLDVHDLCRVFSWFVPVTFPMGKFWWKSQSRRNGIWA